MSTDERPWTQGPRGAEAITRVDQFSGTYAYMSIVLRRIAVFCGVGVEASLYLYLYLGLERLAVSQLLEDPDNRALLHAFLFPFDGEDPPRRT